MEGRSLEQKKALLKWLKRVMRGLDSSDDPAATSPRVKEQLDSSAEHSALSSSVEQQNFRHQLEDNEEYEQLDEWREIRAKRKRKSESRKSGGEDGVESEKAEQESESAREGTPTQQRRRNTTKLVVIELGCGDSLHSLRIEAELMIRENPSGKQNSSLCDTFHYDPSPRAHNTLMRIMLRFCECSEIDTDQPQLPGQDEEGPRGH